jgi:hypothetical protein
MGCQLILTNTGSSTLLNTWPQEGRIPRLASRRRGDESDFRPACKTRKQWTLSSTRLVPMQRPANNGPLWVHISLHMTLQSGP